MHIYKSEQALCRNSLYNVCGPTNWSSSCVESLSLISTNKYSVYIYIHPEKYMKIVKTMSNFCIKNISLAVMMEKMMELSANSNCILFFFPRSGVQNDSGYKKQNKTKKCNQLLTSHLAQLIFLVSNYQKMLQSNNWKMIRGRLLGELRYKNMAVCRKWFDKGYYE